MLVAIDLCAGSILCHRQAADSVPRYVHVEQSAVHVEESAADPRYVHVEQSAADPRYEQSFYNDDVNHVSDVYA